MSFTILLLAILTFLAGCNSEPQSNSIDYQKMSRYIPPKFMPLETVVNYLKSLDVASFTALPRLQEATSITQVFTMKIYKTGATTCANWDVEEAFGITSNLCINGINSSTELPISMNFGGICIC